MTKVFAQVNISDVFSPAKSIPTIGDLVTIILRNALVLAGVISFVLLVLGGVGFILAAGSDPKKLEKSKQTISAAVAGVLIVFCAYWIVQIIEKLTGLSLLTPKM